MSFVIYFVSDDPVTSKHLQIPGNFSPSYYNYIEKMGSMQQLVEQYANCAFVTDISLDWLRCYKDAQIDYLTTMYGYYNQSDCYYTPPSATQAPESGSISIAPNPVNDHLTIRSAEAVITSVQLMDATGRVLFQDRAPDPQQVVVPMTELPAGVYFCRVWFGEQMRTEKVVKW